MGVGVVAILAQGAFVVARWWQERLPLAQSGALADATVATPVALNVVDPEATEAARELEGNRLPPLFRFDPGIADVSADKFMADYDRRCSLFEQGLRRQWPAALTTEELASPRFADFVAAFRLAHLDFPLADSLAQAWAMDGAATYARNGTATELRDLHRHYIIEDTVSPAADGHGEVLLSAPANAGGLEDGSQLEGRAIRVQRRALVTSAAARQRLAGKLADQGEAWQKFAGQFVVANVTFDPALTADARAAFGREVSVRREFLPGESLTELAQPITPLQAAAVAELQRHYSRVALEHAWTRWWLGGFGLLSLAVGGWLAARARRVGQTESIPELWGAEMALEANQRGHLPRQSLFQQMTGWLRQQFIQRLIQQRNDALAGQAGASAQVQVINERLNRLQPEIQERIADYEQRISGLERELLGANEVTRELLKTRISLARKELEIEKAKSNLAWN